MTDFTVTELARPTDDPNARADAIRYLTRTGNTDLIEILGLDNAPARGMNLPKGIKHLGKHERPTPGHTMRNGKAYCTICKRQTRADGICRRSACGGAR